MLRSDMSSELKVNAVLLPTYDLPPSLGKGKREGCYLPISTLLDELDRRGWLHYLQHIQVAQLGVAGYWWLANPHLAAAMVDDGAVARHWIPGLSIIIERGDSVSITFKHPVPKIAGFSALLLWLLTRQAQGSRAKLDYLYLGESFRGSEYLSVFSQKLQFHSDEEAARIEFSTAVITESFVTANNTLLPLFSDCLPFLKFNQPQDLSAQVYTLLEQAEALDKVSPTWIANKLAVSERTLNRQLADLGITFRELLTRFRNSQAIARLCEGESIDRLADYLGFSERAAFERAFKSWQGVTPAKFQSQYRRLSKDVDIEALISPEKLPNMPAIGTQLLALAQREDSSLEQMAALVEQDPVLTAKLISIASSAFYGMKTSSSIKDIVIRVFGVDKLRGLALSILAAGSFRLNHCPAFSLERFWVLSLGTAQLASEFYRKQSKSNEDQADIYLAGLLHNIGRLVLVQSFPHKMQALLETLQKYPAPQELLAMEKLRLGVDSSEAGALLLARWQLPRAVSVIMRQLAVDKVAMMPEAHLLLLAEEFLLAHLENDKALEPSELNKSFASSLAAILEISEAATLSVLEGFSARLADLQATAVIINQT